MAKKEKKKVVIISDSVVESIERSSEHSDKLDAGPSLVNFRGIVHRVNTANTEKENR